MSFHPASSDPHPVPVLGGREQVSTRIGFLIAGFGTSAWAPIVPYAKIRLAIDDGTLGLLLLCLGAGSMLAMPLSPPLCARFGCRRVIEAGGLSICAALLALATVNTLPALALALLGFGAAVGTVDIAINLQAIIVERAAGRTMMSGFHGLYSVGGILGSGGVAALLWLGAAPPLAILCVAAVIVMLLLLFGRHMLPYADAHADALFVMPRGIVLFIGVLCFIAFLSEGAMLDWSAVFLKEARAVDEEYAGLGYALFAVAMTFGRLRGDRAVRRFGDRRVLLFGGMCAAFGFVLAALAPLWSLSLIGFTLVGIGASNIVPVLYSLAGRQTRMPAGLAISSASMLGYSGILIGPVAIGFVARLTNLPIAFLGLAGLLLVVAATSRTITRLAAR